MPDITAILHAIHPEHDFAASGDFVADGLLDSFDIVVLVQKLESGFCISIDGAEITPENFRNLENLKSLVARSAHGQ